MRVTPGAPAPSPRRSRIGACRPSRACTPLLLGVLLAAGAARPAPARAAPPDPPHGGPSAPAQLGAWEAVAPPGTSCGRGAPFKYYLNASSEPEAGIVFLLNGGGACLKEGPAPAGTSGVARALHCMDFGNFEDPVMNDSLFSGLGAALVPIALPWFSRSDAANPFRGDHFVAVPYCTGDVHAGRMTEPFDYDPSPAAAFPVTHRGHWNFLAVVEDVYRRFGGNRRVVLTGVSAGGFGASFNFPEVIERWPRTTLIVDSGIAPFHSDSLMVREGARVAERWGARPLLPAYCADDGCLGDSLRLLAAHAAHFDGSGGPWRPFGFAQSRRDATLVDYLELSACGFDLGLRSGLARPRPANLRAYVPAGDRHVLTTPPGFAAGGVGFAAWFRRLATAEAPGDLPEDLVETTQPCFPTFLPWTQSGAG